MAQSSGLMVKKTLKMIHNRKHNDLIMPSYNSTAYMEKTGLAEKEDDKE